jgi:mannose-6-phosphate isomerase-like protein (cupin superfamily)
MSILADGEITLEVHPDRDQFIRVEEGEGRVVMGTTKDSLTFDKKVSDISLKTYALRPRM